MVCFEVVNLLVEGVHPELLANEHHCIEFVFESRLISGHPLHQTFTNSLTYRLKLFYCLRFCGLGLLMCVWRGVGGEGERAGETYPDQLFI